MWKKGINFVFVGLILCGLLLGLARTVFFPKKINYYENRYANRAALPLSFPVRMLKRLLPYISSRAETARNMSIWYP